VNGRVPRVVVVGDLAVDVLVAPAEPPRPGGDVPARITTSPGGAGANTAAWLAALGVDVTLTARVGADAPGRAAVAELEAAGVRVAVTVDAGAPTATVVVLLRPDGPRTTRTMLSDRGAAARLAADDLPALDGRRNRADHLHLSGYVLLGAPGTGTAALAAARAAGARMSLDPQATGALTPNLLRELGGVDLLLPNTDELAALTGSPDPRSATALLDAAHAVVVTHGAAGATWVDRNAVHTAPAPRVDAVDPTGAGDAFDAGLLAAWLTGADPAAALAAGCAAGAEAVSRRGARPARPRR
jgi:sugar/nucleoside kinase (ribokinase family)